MGMEDFWEQLPTGKEDKPLLFEMGPLEYDFHDIDGYKSPTTQCL